MERMNADIEKRDFFKDPFSETELKKIIKMTGNKPSGLIRKRDKMYKELDLENNKKTDTQLIKLMVKYPGLILRPIVITKNTFKEAQKIRDGILANGGTYAEARQVFLDMISMSKEVLEQFTQEKLEEISEDNQTEEDSEN